HIICVIFGRWAISRLGAALIELNETAGVELRTQECLLGISLTTVVFHAQAGIGDAFSRRGAGAMWCVRPVLVIVCGVGCLMAVSGGPAHAQMMAGMGGIGFRNELPTPVVVRGVSVVNGQRVAGPPILIPPGKVGWDNGLRPGLRVISVHDANQPNL